MKVIKQKTNRHGQNEVTVVLREGEQLMSYRENGYYRLGGQVGDVMSGHVLAETKEVEWCSIAQRWEE